MSFWSLIPKSWVAGGIFCYGSYWYANNKLAIREKGWFYAVPSVSLPATIETARSIQGAEVSLRGLDKMAVHGFPSSDNLRVMSEYACSMNFQKRIPNWVVERMEPYELEKEKKRLKEQSPDAPPDRSHSKFYADTNIPEAFRAQNGDYYNHPPLSKGHLAAAQFDKSSQQTLDETFNLSANIVPQDMTMNGCDWYRLENMVWKIRRSYAKNPVWVVSGPAFVPQTFTNGQDGSTTQEVRYRVIGKHEVAVPTHLFKVVAVEKQNAAGHASELLLSAFLMPNGPLPKEEPLAAYQVPLDQLEKTTGLQFFPKLLHRADKAIAEGESSHRTNIPQPFGKSNQKLSTFDLCQAVEGGCVGNYGSFSPHHRLVAQLRTASSYSACEDVMSSPEAIQDQGTSLKKEFTKCINRFSLPPPDNKK